MYSASAASTCTNCASNYYSATSASSACTSCSTGKCNSLKMPKKEKTPTSHILFLTVFVTFLRKIQLERWRICMLDFLNKLCCGSIQLERLYNLHLLPSEHFFSFHRFDHLHVLLCRVLLRLDGTVCCQWRLRSRKVCSHSSHCLLELWSWDLRFVVVFNHLLELSRGDFCCLDGSHKLHGMSGGIVLRDHGTDCCYGSLCRGLVRCGFLLFVLFVSCG